jgi:hypothetical protein
VIPNRGSPPAILLRESFRENGKTKNRTLANLSGWSAERIDLLRAVLRGERLLPAADAMQIVRALPHGHVLAALDTTRRIDLDALLPRRAPRRRRDLALALIIARMLDPAAKLATARMLDPSTASHSLGEVLARISHTGEQHDAEIGGMNSRHVAGHRMLGERGCASDGCAAGSAARGSRNVGCAVSGSCQAAACCNRR